MIPVSISLQNFISHKESFIDFSKFKSALLIGNVEGDYSISNGSGKTSILESILWALFNKARISPIDDIISWGQKSCKVEFCFNHSGGKYKIIRTRDRQTSTSSVNIFKLVNDESWENISGSTPSLTNDKIVDIIKADYKTFINSVYFRQNDISEFAEADAGRRKEILKSIVDISKWDTYESVVKNKLKDIKIETTKCEALSDGFTEVQKQFVETNDQLSLIVSKFDEDSINEVALSNEYNALFNTYQKIKQNVDTDTWDKVVDANEKFSKEILIINSKLPNLNSEIDISDKFISASKQDINDIDRQCASNPYVDVTGPISDINNELLKFKTEQSAVAMYLADENLKVYPENICPVCEQGVSGELHEHLSKIRNEKVVTYEKRKIYALNKINECLLKKSQLEEQENVNNKYFKLLEKKKAQELLIEQRVEKLSSYREQLASLELTKMDLANKIAANNEILESLKNDSFQDINKRLDIMKEKRDLLLVDISSKTKEIGVLSERKNNLVKKIDSMKEYLEKLKGLNHKKNIYEKLSKYYGKNGIQTILLNAIIEDLEQASNLILDSICSEPFTILLETQRMGSDGVTVVDTLDLKVRKDGATQNFSSLSGGEMFRVCLAIRIALSEISSRHGGSSLDFLMLDEINSPLDRNGTDSLFVNIIKRLEERYKILIITHNDMLKEKFSNIIDITKINGESSVKVLDL